MDATTPKVSILVPLKAPGPHLRECVAHCLALDYPDFEVLILPDEPFSRDEFFAGLPVQGREVHIPPTGPVGPAEKRDLALRYARGDILAFLDDDAFPRKDWLKKALRHFSFNNTAHQPDQIDEIDQTDEIDQ
jgi:cellulose synthase/poly-beta-1,6-N-acetylglucosamine synthase-like glycosyltransferase